MFPWAFLLKGCFGNPSLKPLPAEAGVKTAVRTSSGVGFPGDGGLAREQGRSGRGRSWRGCRSDGDSFGGWMEAAGDLERHGPAEQVGALGGFISLVRVQVYL